MHARTAPHDAAADFQTLPIFDHLHALFAHAVFHRQLLVGDQLIQLAMHGREIRGLGHGQHRAHFIAIGMA